MHGLACSACGGDKAADGQLTCPLGSTAPANPMFAVTDLGANSCPSRTTAITSAAQCEAALSLVASPVCVDPEGGLRDCVTYAKFDARCQLDAYDTWYPARPSGCVQDRNGLLLFNEHAPTDPVCPYMRIVCTKAGLPGPTDFG